MYLEKLYAGGCYILPLVCVYGQVPPLNLFLSNQKSVFSCRMLFPGQIMMHIFVLGAILCKTEPGWPGFQLVCSREAGGREAHDGEPLLLTTETTRI